MQGTLLGVERLEGQNQYECAFCCRKVDAERQMRLRNLPPYLCISLQRFVFDLKVRPREGCSAMPLMLAAHCHQS